MKNKKHNSKNHLSFEKRTLVELSVKDTINVNGGDKEHHDIHITTLLKTIGKTNLH